MDTKIHPGTTIVVGLDLSLSATGVVVVKIGKDRHKLIRSAVCSAPEPGGVDDKGLRLSELADSVVSQVGLFPDEHYLFFAEGYSFGSPFAARRIGETHGAVISRVYQQFRAPVRYVTPASAKMIACPNHPGWSKDKWAAAKKPGKWKRSMPSKEDVMRGVFDRFKISLATDAEADAFCVAIGGLLRYSKFDATSRKIVDARTFE